MPSCGPISQRPPLPAPGKAGARERFLRGRVRMVAIDNRAEDCVPQIDREMQK
jgi:hypothetical protein